MSHYTYLDGGDYLEVETPRGSMLRMMHPTDDDRRDCAMMVKLLNKIIDDNAREANNNTKN